GTPPRVWATHRPATHPHPCPPTPRPRRPPRIHPRRAGPGRPRPTAAVRSCVPSAPVPPRWTTPTPVLRSGLALRHRGHHRFRTAEPRAPAPFANGAALDAGEFSVVERATGKTTPVRSPVCGDDVRVRAQPCRGRRTSINAWRTGEPYAPSSDRPSSARPHGRHG